MFKKYNTASCSLSEGVGSGLQSKLNLLPSPAGIGLAVQGGLAPQVGSIGQLRLCHPHQAGAQVQHRAEGQGGDLDDEGQIIPSNSKHLPWLGLLGLDLVGIDLAGM
eukprot:1104731-Alexandrium_andersonii.AAC.1